MRIFVITSFLLAGLGFIPAQVAYGQSEDDLARAGCPNQTSRFARVGYGSRYIAYYVGGGAHSRFGDSRHCDEGTFGVDYQPIVPGFHNAVVLGWWHGRRYQGSTGQYQPNTTVQPFPNLSPRTDRSRPAIY